jgi:CRP-like cAMP-binding protein
MKLSQQDADVIRRVPLFSGLPEPGLATLLAGATVQEAGPREILFLQGDPADRFYAVLEGWVKLYRQTPNGDETVIGIVTRGETFAEAAMFGSGRFPVNAESVAPTRLVCMPARQVMAELRRDFDLTRNILAAMSRHLRDLVQQVEQLKSKSASQRVGNFLLLLIDDHSKPAPIQLPYDKLLIAARLGMTPETFSRALAKLRDLGVRSEGNAVVVPEPAALHSYCNRGREV